MAKTIDEIKLAAKRCIAEVDAMFEPVFDFDPKTGEIWLDGVISPSAEDINAAAVRYALREIGKKPVVLYLNCPGGAVHEGWAIFRLLTQHPAKVTTVVANLAASMAATLLQAGSERIINKSGLVMIHNPWCGVVGDSNTFEREVELLRKMERQLVDIFVAKTGLPAEEIQRMMDQETWFTAQEAIEAGFADRIEEEYQPATNPWTKAAVLAAIAAINKGIAPKDDPAFVAARWPNRAQWKKKVALCKASIMAAGIFV